MRRVNLSVLLAALVVPIRSLAPQTGSMRVTVPSPTAASLGKFGDIPVSLHTGTPDISIPLFTAKGKTLEVPIVLRYHASGIKVEEIGGWAGIGWTLEAGGTITRTVRGLPDDHPTAGYYTRGRDFYQAGSPTTAQIVDIGNGALDGEPDQFFFNFAGRSGQFVVGPVDAAGTIEYRVIPHQKLRIEPTGTDFASWVITTEDGTRYTFAVVEWNTDWSITNPANEIPSNWGTSYKAAWNLTEIRSPGGDVVTFAYAPQAARHLPVPYKETFHQVVSAPGEQCVQSSFEATNEYETTTNYLASITTGAHLITFTTTTRTDVADEKRLDRITVKTSGGVVLRVFKFEHDYSTGRLSLTRVFEEDASGAQLPPYTFTYWGPVLPSLTSKAQDHWGYYNGKTNNQSLLPPAVTPSGAPIPGDDRNLDLAFITAGALRKVAYPTGGYTELTYGPNVYGSSESGVPMEWGPPESAEARAEAFQGIQSTTFTVGGTASTIATVDVALWPVCSDQIGCPWTDLSGTGGSGFWRTPGTYYVELTPGNYTIRASDDWTDGFAVITVTWREWIPAVRDGVTGAYAGGLRVNQIVTDDGFGNQTIRKYKYTLQSDPTLSSGELGVQPGYTFPYWSSTCSYFSRSAMSRMPLGDGPIVGYSEVEVWHGSNGEFGKTRHKFLSGHDALPVGLWPFSRRTSYAWARGHETKTTEYDATARIQQDVVQTHAFWDGGENLLRHAEQLANATWTLGNVSVAENSTTAPNGSWTAAKFTEDAAVAWHGEWQPFAYTPGAVLYASVSMKAAERTTGHLLVGSGNAHFRASYDLVAGTVISTSANSNANGTGEVLAADIVSEGGGWYRVRLKGRVTGTITTLYFATYIGTTSYQGDGASGIYVWAASVSRQSYGYVPTSVASLDFPRFKGVSVHAFSSGSFGSNYFFNPFEVIVPWVYLESATTTVYDTTGAFFSTGKTIVYGNANHAQPTQVTETGPDGAQRITRMKYPADYATGPGDEAVALTAMQGSAHIHSPVVERWVLKRVTGAPDSVMQAEVTSFKTFAAVQYLPRERFVFNSPAGATNFVPSSVTTGGFTKDGRYLRQETAETYDASGRITRLKDARDYFTDFWYDTDNSGSFLTQVKRWKSGTSGEFFATDLTYDQTTKYLSSITDEAGTTRSFGYDTFGRLTQVKNDGNALVTQYAYSYSRTSPNWTFQTASPNAVTTTTYLQASPAVTVVSKQFLDGLGRPIQTVTSGGDSVVIAANQYDAVGRPWRTWKPYRRVGSGLNYDQTFTSAATVYYASHGADVKPYVETLYRADGLGRVSKVISEFVGTSPSPSNWVASAYGVESGLQVVEMTDQSGKKRRTFTDAFGNLVKTILGFGASEATTTQLFYNILGQRTKATDPRNLNTTYALDTRGLLTSMTSPDAGTIGHKYDKSGNLRYTQDANQAAAGRVYFTNYDFVNRPLTSGQGTATFASLNPAVTEAFETTQGNWLVVREYDEKPLNVFPWSQFWTQISLLTLSNVSGRLSAVASKSNGAWQVILFSYDVDGQVVKRYTYTQASGGGSVLTALNTTSTYARDLRGALTSRADTVGSNTFHHWYEYDNRGLLWKVFASTSSNQPGTPDVTYAYRPSGQVQSRQFAGGPVVPLTYTIQEQLRLVADPADTTYPFSARYGYHPNGTVDTAEFYSGGSPATQKRYRYLFPAASYDALNRLKSADFSSWSGSSWTSTLAYDLAGISYDRAGNLTALQRYRETGTLIDNLTYTIAGASNRLTSVTDAISGNPETWDARTGTFAYDANGNITTLPAPYSITTPITYDHQNLPLSITRSGTATTYRYNDAGQRIAKQVGTGNTDIYLLDGATSLGVFTVNAAGTPVSWYFNVLAGDKVVGRQPSAGDRRHYHTDLLGSTRAVTDSGLVLESYDFEPWGLLMPGRTLAGPTKEGFTGKEQDAETGLDYFGARYYMPALGRWTAVDPAADQFPAWTPYNYTYNSPLALTDPDGREISAPSSQREADELLTWAQEASKKVMPVLVARAEYWRAARRSQESLGLEYDPDLGFVRPGEGLAVWAAQRGHDWLVNLAAGLDAAHYLLELAAGGGDVGCAAEAMVCGTGPAVVLPGVAPPNPGGKLGSPAHRAGVEAAARELEQSGAKVIAGGGRLPERAVQVAGGRIRFPDVIAVRPDGSLVYVNVGRVTRAGAPVAREARALQDLSGTGTKTTFVPYHP